MLLLLAGIGCVTGRLRLCYWQVYVFGMFSGLGCYWQALVVLTGKYMLLLLKSLTCY